MARQMEEAESRGSQLSRSKTVLQSQLEELKKSLDEEVKVSVWGHVRVYVGMFKANDIRLRDHIDTSALH